MPFLNLGHILLQSRFFGALVLIGSSGLAGGMEDSFVLFSCVWALTTLPRLFSLKGLEQVLVT